ncbi:glycosyltransferase family 2 protein [Desulfospira joergensenii]|uniref:glycosyltransferase family 2 protein n=1 Tax=Desulfospira joergensenii TaxID=53329 RepID=UPI0004267293|nr:glycosyltransferase family 2 protein [Desulfospira joergensenii]
MNSISVIVPTHNRPDLLQEALSSLEKQTVKPSEVIVVDDGSVKPVDEKLLKKQFSIELKVLFNESSKGLAWARHQGVEYATSEFIVHLDDDDLLAPDGIENVMELFESNPELDIVFLGVEGFGSRARYFNQAQKKSLDQILKRTFGPTTKENVHFFNDRLFGELLQSVPMAFQRAVVRRETWHAVSTFRFRCYSKIRDKDFIEGRKRITGPLRDSEWAFYGVALNKRFALIKNGLYLQRCEGQGKVSNPEQRQAQMNQLLCIKKKLYGASQKYGQLSVWENQIKSSLARSYFNTSYYHLSKGSRITSLKYLIKAVKLKPKPTYIKFFIRTFFPL